MSAERVLEDAREQIRKIAPSDVNIAAIEFEGPVVVIYTKDMEKFASNNDIVRQLAQGLRRRVAIRPDPSMLANPETVEKRIREIIPEEAQITDIYFEDDTGEVTIEAIAPGLVIGKHGSILNEIKKEVGWAPKVVRAPPLPSKTVSDIRAYLRTISDDRKVFLKKVGRRLARPRIEGESWIRMTALGGYREVGRSATLLSTRESKVLIDCGIDPSDKDGGTPYFNAPEIQPLDALDAVVITHAHMDHCALLPALYKYGYDGPVYCTPPTRDLMSLMQLDGIKVSYGEGKKAPYESSHVREVVAHCIPLKYGETTDIAPDMRLTFQNAGHILGSAVCHFHIGDGLYNIAFTGDMKFERTWLFNATVNKFPRLETLVMEATYGGYRDVQPSRIDAGNTLKAVCERVLARNGKILIPVFAVGRSQEVMLVLEELIRTGKLPNVPIYLDGMIWEATAIHTAYPEYLNSQLRTQIFQMGQNPFLSQNFKRVETQDMRERICHDVEPCIVLSTSGMMNGGPVLEYLKAWADDPKNCLVFVGYNAEGTLGSKIQRGWSELTLSERGKPVTVKMKMDVETAEGFSGHSDRRQLMAYIASLDPKPERIVIGHGEEHKCSDLASSIYKKFNVETRAPMNLETIRMK
ncbi:beta-CASP ribonuclease aCPSF1 [Methanomassiliicoccus luminyensis]|uniref:beta-CASP ribonuclease aCPSF1 n=1 Tax=Methanomassiliicoccus luminyensis TaxID=1080712 RepID=UPI0003636004|nr:beta-CASP ribonuclease aCPSF1 [Methanomassiliicoccus luminyensis]